MFDAPWQEEHDDARIRPQAYLVRKFFRNKTFLPKNAILVFLTPNGLIVDISSNLIAC